LPLPPFTCEQHIFRHLVRPEAMVRRFIQAEVLLQEAQALASGAADRNKNPCPGVAETGVDL
jgi:hypothetical protein